MERSKKMERKNRKRKKEEGESTVETRKYYFREKDPDEVIRYSGLGLKSSFKYCTTTYN